MKLISWGVIVGVLLLGAACDREGNKKDKAGGSAGQSDGSNKQTLADARKGHKTRLFREQKGAEPPPQPPAELLKLVKYPSPAGELAAYLSKPKAGTPAGKKHPAIIWVTGGFGNDIGATVWEKQPARDDQSASAFWKAGVVTMYPSFRGGNGNPGAMEILYGEVDDVLAAADSLAKQPEVDPARIYLGGHSTGGTLAMLVAEIAPAKRFRAIFAAGPVDNIAKYPADDVPFDMSDLQEVKLRSPLYWMHGVATPTFVFEGEDGGNIDELNLMKKMNGNDSLKFFPVPNADHFSVLRPLTQLIAQKILADTGADTNVAFTPNEMSQLVKAR